jgi:hypothetical protein
MKLSAKRFPSFHELDEESQKHQVSTVSRVMFTCCFCTIGVMTNIIDIFSSSLAYANLNEKIKTQTEYKTEKVEYFMQHFLSYILTYHCLNFVSFIAALYFIVRKDRTESKEDLWLLLAIYSPFLSNLKLAGFGTFFFLCAMSQQNYKALFFFSFNCLSEAILTSLPLFTIQV